MTNRSDPTSSELITSAVLRLGRRLRAERPADAVPISQLAALTLLTRHGGMTAVRLAQLMRLQPQSLTRLIASLEEDGLITREPGKTDRRTIMIEVSRTGRAAVRHDMAARQAWLETAMHQVLSLEEQAQLRKAALAMLKLADAGT